MKKTFSWRDPTDKQRNVEDEVYDNYKVIQGIPTPYTVTRYFNGDMAGQRFMSWSGTTRELMIPSSSRRLGRNPKNLERKIADLCRFLPYAADPDPVWKSANPNSRWQ